MYITHGAVIRYCFRLAAGWFLKSNYRRGAAHYILHIRRGRMHFIDEKTYIIDLIYNTILCASVQAFSLGPFRTNNIYICQIANYRAFTAVGFEFFCATAEFMYFRFLSRAQDMNKLVLSFIYVLLSCKILPCTFILIRRNFK